MKKHIFIALTLVSLHTTSAMQESYIVTISPSEKPSFFKDYPYPLLDYAISAPKKNDSNEDNSVTYYRHIPSLHIFAMDKVPVDDLTINCLPGSLINELLQYKKSIFTKNQKEALALHIYKIKDFEDDFDIICTEFIRESNKAFFKQDPLEVLRFIFSHTKMPVSMIGDFVYQHLPCARAIEQLHPWLKENKYYENQQSPLYGIMRTGYKETKKHLLDNSEKMSPNTYLKEDDERYFALVNSIQCNDEAMVESLLDKTSQAMLPTQLNKLLSFATCWGAYKTFAPLAQHIANIQDDYILKSISVENIPMLLDLGANINGKISHGETLLDKAVCENDYAMATYLIQHGAQVNLSDNEGFTPMHAVAENVLGFMGSAIEVDACTEMAELLIKHGAQVNSSSKNGTTPLHRAADKGSIVMTTFLLSHKANLQARNERRQTPLNIANSWIIAVDCLCRFGPEKNAKGLSYNKEKKIFEELAALLEKASLATPTN